MTGLLRRSFWCALHFCILNRYEARSKNVFCKQTADLCNKNFFPPRTETSLQTSIVKRIFWCIGSEKMLCTFRVTGLFYIQTLLYTYSI